MAVNIYDVALYILQKTNEVSTMKLQKLCYYSQAWSLVWDEAPLFNNEFEAWQNGPVNRDLYYIHRGLFKINENLLTNYGDISKLSTLNKETIDVVINDYGDKTGFYLSQLTHSENPWIISRDGIPESAPCENIITVDSMYEYYSSL